jgi:hypothetical protein
LVIEKQVRLNFMQHSISCSGGRGSKVIEQAHRNGDPTGSRVPEARYSYYRRCQLFRKNGEQCKAPAEKGSHICYAHAGQQAMAFRRDLERRIMLAEAVAEMRRQRNRDCDMTNLLMDFKGIQVTLAVMSRALINGRIDGKTAGRLLVNLQTVSKLLRMHGTKTKTLPLINTDNTDLKDSTTEKPGLSTKPWRHQHQDRTGVVGDHEDARGAGNNALSISASEAASAGNTKIVTIRSAKQTPCPFRTFQRHGFNPVLLTG